MNFKRQAFLGFSRLLFLSVIFLGGCVTYHPHPWTREIPGATSVALVPQARISNVLEAQLDRAVNLLADADFIALDPKTAAEIAQVTLSPQPNEKLYLVRGVAWTSPPQYRAIYVERRTRALRVYSYTYDIDPPSYGDRFSFPSPVIICLPFEPTAVYPVADHGDASIAPTSFGKSPAQPH